MTQVLKQDKCQEQADANWAERHKEQNLSRNEITDEDERDHDPIGNEPVDAVLLAEDAIVAENVADYPESRAIGRVKGFCTGHPRTNVTKGTRLIKQAVL